MPTRVQEPLSLKIYRSLSRAAEPVANFALRHRLKKGKEDAARIDERRGISNQHRPDGILIWIHGASVGESLSVIPLVQRLQARRPDLKFLVTTGTVTSANLMAKRLPEGAVHQFIPLDHPGFCFAFSGSLATRRSDLCGVRVLAKSYSRRAGKNSFHDARQRPCFTKLI